MTESSKVQTKTYNPAKTADGSVVPPFTWMDADRGSAEWRALGEELLSARIGEEHFRDALNTEHPPFFDGSSAAHLLVFPVFGEGVPGERFSYSSDCALFTTQSLVTIRNHEHCDHAQLASRVEKDGGNRSASAIEFLLRMLTIRADEFLHSLDPLQERLDCYRDRILDPYDRVADWPDMYRHRTYCRQMIGLLRQEEAALIDWNEHSGEEFSVRASIRFSNLLEHVRRAINELREIESEVDSLVDLHFTATAHQTNEIMRVLTVLSAIFLPLTFIAGIFGMNFENMPELKFHLGYPVALLSMVTLAGILFMFFRRKRWV